MIDWTAVAANLLAEVGLSFDDVYDLGREWVRGPVGLQFMTGKPAYRGICHRPSQDNPTSRRRHLIGLTGPVDGEWMAAILAHECGHVFFDHGRFISTPDYIQEAQAEMYAHNALAKQLGRWPHPFLVESGKKYVRGWCWHRFRELGADPTKGWRQSVVEWCGFDPGVELDFR